MIPAIGLLVGILAGLLLHPAVPVWLQPYLPIAVIAALDAVFGGVRAVLDGIFVDKVFVVSFLSNVLVAAFIVFLGDQLGVGHAAVHRRRRRPRRPDLLQRGLDPSPPVQGLSHDRAHASDSVAAERDDPARGSSSWRRLARAGAPRSTKAQALGAALALALGFAIATQIQQTQDSGLDSMRQDDLVRVLDDVSQRSSRLDAAGPRAPVQRDA